MYASCLDVQVMLEGEGITLAILEEKKITLGLFGHLGVGTTTFQTWFSVQTPLN